MLTQLPPSPSFPTSLEIVERGGKKKSDLYPSDRLGTWHWANRLGILQKVNIMNGSNRYMTT